eukprot:evm.model.scf_52.21 EVM.evm.TU.scf_52.21   scf_52:165961-174383(-)
MKAGLRLQLAAPGGIGVRLVGRANGSEELWVHALRLRRRAPRRRRYTCTSAKKGRRRKMILSDGDEHLGSSLTTAPDRPFPGPSGKKGPPLRILPLGGLGEIGMNCMLVGVYNRYILIDAGLMFPDFYDLGMQRILPDTSFLHQWRDKIEAVVITHGHEDHIGAIPWVLPSLDPSTPIFASGFVMQLLKHRLEQYNLWDDGRMHTMSMRRPFTLGPFECEPFHVTHSIPDCCGLILRSEHGVILHTGDWKMDEGPVDGWNFDISAFESVAKEGVTLLMSDSTNALTPGRTYSELQVQKNLMQRVTQHDGKGRIVATMFASNLHRLASIKKAADASGRKLFFMGMSLHTYLEAAQKSGFAPFDPKDLNPSAELEDANPNEVLVVTTGSQAEPRAALSLAARDASVNLKLTPDDLVLYSAKTIPGNEKRVMKMMNSIANRGAEIAMGKDEGLHASGHAYRDELADIIKTVKPQHFLPIHGELVFMTKHAEMAQELGVQRTRVIRDGELLGVKHLRKRQTVASGAMPILGDVNLVNFYNDGNKGTGTYSEMGLTDRLVMAVEGVVVVAVDVHRASVFRRKGPGQQTEQSVDGGVLRARVRITTRGMWTDRGNLVKELYRMAQGAVATFRADAALSAVERVVAQEIRRACMKYNSRRPEVIVIAHEFDPRAGAAVEAQARRKIERESELRKKNSKEVLGQEGDQGVQGPPSESDTAPAKKAGKTSRRRRASSRPQDGAEADAQPGSKSAAVAESSPSTSKGSAAHTPSDSSSGNSAKGAKKGGSKSDESGGEERAKTGRRGRPRGRRSAKKSVQADADFGGPSDIRPVSPEVMAEYRKRNPRENPGATDNDLDYG